MIFLALLNKYENALHHHKGSALGTVTEITRGISQKLSSYRKSVSCPFQVED